jgi:hypothetical protein
MKSYVELAGNMPAIETLGKWIAASGMFGTLTLAQGQVIAAHCFITETPLLDYQRRNMLVGNRPGIPYDAMVAAFQEGGGSLKVIEKSANAARVELTVGGVTTPFALTWDEAKREPFVYGEKGTTEKEIVQMIRNEKWAELEKIMKPKYASPRSRAIMLWARCVSDAIRTVDPKANFGTYTEEELEDIPSSAPAPTAPAAASTTQPVHPPAPPRVPLSSVSTPPAQAEPEVMRPVLPAAVETIESPVSERIDGPASEEQRVRCLELLAEIEPAFPGVKAKLAEKLKSAGIQGGIRGLTIGEAVLLVKSLENRAIDAFFTLDLKGHYQPPFDAK